jgi:hypothetical protein
VVVRLMGRVEDAASNEDFERRMSARRDAMYTGLRKDACIVIHDAPRP